jgi:DNA repair protein RadC
MRREGEMGPVFGAEEGAGVCDDADPDHVRMVRGRYTVRTVRVRLRVADAGPQGAVGGPKDAARIAEAVFLDLEADQEHFVVLALNAKHHVVGFKTVHSGGMDSSIVDVRLVFRAALLLGAHSIILVHNHPSGDPEPSADDVRLTARLAEAGRLLGMPVLDHLVLGSGRYVSLKEKGMMLPD